MNIMREFRVPRETVEQWLRSQQLLGDTERVTSTIMCVSSDEHTIEFVTDTVERTAELSGTESPVLSERKCMECDATFKRDMNDPKWKRAYAEMGAVADQCIPCLRKMQRGE